MKTLIQNPISLFWLCMLLHLLADFHFQGILASMKQKNWWPKAMKSLPWKTRCKIKQSHLFDYDYVMALLCHALMWSLITLLPLMLAVTPLQFSLLIGANTVFHAIVDHAKANKLWINLWVDQLLHVLQIAATVAVVHYFM